jgi:hypothetical protein
MKPEAQRIAIAEACGWIQGTQFGLTGNLGVTYQKGCKIVSLNGLPDYLNDLNAMHEAEKTLTNAQRRRYVDELVEVHPLHYHPCGDKQDDRNMATYFLISATASQRAEAFLRTLGKWVEE